MNYEFLYIHWNPDLVFFQLGPIAVRWYGLCWLLGARLGHCIFYEPDYFLTSVRGIIEMFLPIRFMMDGGIKFVGYEGLASHGGTLGLMIALWLYVRKTKLSLWRVLDNIAIATGSMACFIRLGNLMNSEIIGKVTEVPWAFIFERVDQMPRHPGQLYEAIAYGILFCLMWWMHKKWPERIGTGCSISSPSASSSNTPKRYRKPSKPPCL